MWMFRNGSGSSSVSSSAALQDTLVDCSNGRAVLSIAFCDHMLSCGSVPPTIDVQFIDSLVKSKRSIASKEPPMTFPNEVERLIKNNFQYLLIASSVESQYSAIEQTIVDLIEANVTQGSSPTAFIVIHPPTVLGLVAVNKQSVFLFNPIVSVSGINLENELHATVFCANGISGIFEQLASNLQISQKRAAYTAIHVYELKRLVPVKPGPAASNTTTIPISPATNVPGSTAYWSRVRNVGDWTPGRHELDKQVNNRVARQLVCAEAAVRLMNVHESPGRPLLSSILDLYSTNQDFPASPALSFQKIIEKVDRYQSSISIMVNLRMEMKDLSEKLMTAMTNSGESVYSIAVIVNMADALVITNFSCPRRYVVFDPSENSGKGASFVIEENPETTHSHVMKILERHGKEAPVEFVIFKLCPNFITDGGLNFRKIDVMPLTEFMKSYSRFVVSRAPAANILLVGRSQVGKTTLIRTLLDPTGGARRLGFSQTNEPIFETLCIRDPKTGLRYQLNIIDTPGLGEVREDGTSRDDEALMDLAVRFSSRNIVKLNLVCFVSEAGRMQLNDLIPFRKLTSFLGPEFSQVAMIVLTNAESTTEEKRKQYEQDLLADDEAAEFLSHYCQGRLAFVGCVDLDELDALEKRASNKNTVTVLRRVSTQKVWRMRDQLLKVFLEASQVNAVPVKILKEAQDELVNDTLEKNRNKFILNLEKKISAIKEVNQ